MKFFWNKKKKFDSLFFKQRLEPNSLYEITVKTRVPPEQAGGREPTTRKATIRTGPAGILLIKKRVKKPSNNWTKEPSNNCSRTNEPSLIKPSNNCSRTNKPSLINPRIIARIIQPINPRIIQPSNFFYKPSLRRIFFPIFLQFFYFFTKIVLLWVLKSRTSGSGSWIQVRLGFGSGIRVRPHLSDL